MVISDKLVMPEYICEYLHPTVRGTTINF